MRKWFGIGGIDLVIQLVLTGLMAGIVDSSAPTPSDAPVMAVFMVSLIVLAIRRHFALLKLPLESTGELAALRVEDLEQRLAELEHGQMRMQEIEERLDFAERLLTQRADQSLPIEPR